LDTSNVGWRSAVVSVGLKRGRDDQGRATRPHGERGSKGASEEVEAGGGRKGWKGGKRSVERAEVEVGKTVKR
jgi:hypothetical protein